jgi:hypothetical protein
VAAKPVTGSPVTRLRTEEIAISRPYPRPQETTPKPQLLRSIRSAQNSPTYNKPSKPTSLFDKWEIRQSQIRTMSTTHLSTTVDSDVFRQGVRGWVCRQSVVNRPAYVACEIDRYWTAETVLGGRAGHARAETVQNSCPQPEMRSSEVIEF